VSILPILEPSLALLVRQTVLTRLVEGRHGGSLVSRGGTLEPHAKAVAKYALVELRNLNPAEELSDAETALLRGISLDTLKTEKEERKLTENNAKENRRNFGGK